MSGNSDRTVCIAGADRIIDGSGGPPLEHAALLIRNGLIHYVGPAATLPPHEDAEMIDASGLTVMPGLIDGDAGFTGELGTIAILRRYVQYGVTTIAAFNGNVPGKRPAAPLRDAIERGELPGCARLLVGHVVNGTNGHNRGRKADGPWEVRRAVREMAGQGVDFIKTSATGGFVDTADGKGVHTLSYTPEELYALMDEAHAWGLTVNVHAHSQPGIDRALEAGVDRLMHGCFMDEAGAEKLAARGAWYIPTLRITSRDNMAAFAGGVLEMKETAHSLHRQAVRMALAAGANIALGSHAPGPSSLWKPGESTAAELLELAAAGLSPLQAIAAGTLQAAKAYGIDRRVGSLALGKQADLVAVLGDPSQHVSLLRDPRRIMLVMQKGNIVHATGKFRNGNDVAGEG